MWILCQLKVHHKKRKFMLHSPVGSKSSLLLYWVFFFIYFRGVVSVFKMCSDVCMPCSSDGRPMWNANDIHIIWVDQGQSEHLVDKSAWCPFDTGKHFCVLESHMHTTHNILECMFWGDWVFWQWQWPTLLVPAGNWNTGRCSSYKSKLEIKIRNKVCWKVLR